MEGTPFFLDYLPVLGGGLGIAQREYIKNGGWCVCPGRTASPMVGPGIYFRAPLVAVILASRKKNPKSGISN